MNRLNLLLMMLVLDKVLSETCSEGKVKVTGALNGENGIWDMVQTEMTEDDKKHCFGKRVFTKPGRPYSLQLSI